MPGDLLAERAPGDAPEESWYGGIDRTAETNEFWQSKGGVWLVGGPMDGQVAYVSPTTVNVIIEGSWYGRSACGKPEFIYHCKADAVDMEDPRCIKLMGRARAAGDIRPE